MNRNKRSITVNFKQPEGLAIVHRLVKQADVLVENFVSGKLAEMGLGYEECRQLNPRLIYASITGMAVSVMYCLAGGCEAYWGGVSQVMDRVVRTRKPRGMM